MQRPLGGFRNLGLRGCLRHLVRGRGPNEEVRQRVCSTVKYKPCIFLPLRDLLLALAEQEGEVQTKRCPCLSSLASSLQTGGSFSSRTNDNEEVLKASLDALVDALQIRWALRCEQCVRFVFIRRRHLSKENQVSGVKNSAGDLHTLLSTAPGSRRADVKVAASARSRSGDD